MVQDQKSASSTSRAEPSSSSQRRTKRDRLRMLSEGLRGLFFGGVAFLLGGCPLLFGAAPLGLALLSAASSYTWYILIGLLLSAAFRPVTLSGWTWTGVYLLCVILRLVIRFFVDPPTLRDGRPCGGRTYLLLCWESFRRNVGFWSEGGSPAGDTVTDYYAGAVDSLHHADGPQTDTGRAPWEGARDDRDPSDFHPRLFREHPFLRVLTAAVCGFAAGVFGLIAGGFHVFDLLVALFFLVLTPIASFLFISCFSESGLLLLFSPDPLGRGREGSIPRDARVSKRFHAMPLVSVCCLLGCLVLSVRGYRLMAALPYLGVSAATLLGLTLTLFGASRLGTVPGITLGAICGLAADPELSPLFILCAAAYGILRYVSHRAGVVGSCAVGVALCFYFDGTGGFVSHLPAIILTIPVFLTVETLWSKLPSAQALQESEDDMRDVASLFSSVLALESRSHTQRKRMQALSEAFESLSKRFYDLSDQLKRPRMLDLRRICDESFSRQCGKCRNRDVCWGAEYDRTLEAQARLAAQLHTGGKADADALPDSLRDFCPYLDTVVEDINRRHARMTEILLRSEKTEVFAADYAAIAALLNKALEEDLRAADDFACNRRAADAIYEYLSDEGIPVRGVVVGGKRQSLRQRVIIRGGDFGTVRDKLPEIKARMEEICGIKLTDPEFSSGEDGTPDAVMTLCSRATMKTAYSGSTVPAGRGDDPLPPPLTQDTSRETYMPPAVCGDHIAMFRTEEAYFYALISDGMGSGEDAAMTSDICAMFLEKMLSAGNRVEISLRMLDSVIRSKNTGTGDECSATVDLMELDLMDGHAVFAKNGAAPTYVVRDGTVYKLRSHTLPIGILPDTQTRLLRFRMHPGDVVVMVSDGVTMGNDECPWLIDLLASPMPENMDSLRLDIIRHALSAGSEDDLTAIAIRVEEE